MNFDFEICVVDLINALIQLPLNKACVSELCMP